MQSLLRYSYDSPVLRVSTLDVGSGIAIDIVVVSDEVSNITVGFNRSDSNLITLKYSHAASIVRSTICAIEDVLRTDNLMVRSLKAADITIEMPISSLVESRRLRMYKRLIDKHAYRMHQDESIKFSYVKTDIINNVIKIFIQRT